MLRAAAAALACLCLARCSPPEVQMHARSQAIYNPKDLTIVLANIEERLRVLDTIGAVQMKQARRLDVIQDKLDRVETTLSMRMERAQLAAEKLEHRIHILQTNIQMTIKESSEKLERSQRKITDLAQNLTRHIEAHKRFLDKVNGAYADTWHRGLVLESMLRDGLSLVNATRRELADGLRTLARRQRVTSSDVEATFTRRLHDNTHKIDLKMQEVLDAQKHFMDNCQRVQHDDPSQVADVLGKLMDSLIEKIASIFHELKTVQVTMRTHDNKLSKLLNNGRLNQNDATCKRLENVFRNSSHVNFKEYELHQLTEKFVALTDRADSALQRLELRLNDEDENTPALASDVTAEADQLMLTLKGIKSENEDEEFEDGYYDDGGDLMGADKVVLSGARKGRQAIPAGSERRRHPHNHPYDRGPKKRPPS